MTQQSASATRGRRASLTRERIVEAALRICDQEADLEALTMRRLARELQVGAMTLYSYFQGRDDVLDAMADHVLGGIQLPEQAPEGPADALRQVSYALLATMRRNPSAARLLVGRLTDSPGALDGGMEKVLARLIEAGIPKTTAVRAYGFLISYAIGFANYQMPRSWGRQTDPESEERRRQRRHFYAALPVGRFPNVVELADEITQLANDDQFTFGIESLISSVLTTQSGELPATR